MKMMTAALVASQVMLAFACKPAPCKDGCELEISYEPKLRFGRGRCGAVGEELDLFVPITSCDVVDKKPLYFGQCRAGADGQAVCTGRGLCVKVQRVKESRFSCKCGVECEETKHCPVGEFCRAKKAQSGCSATEKECVPYAKLGESCGGLRLGCFDEQCASGLGCKGDGLAVDLPGTCQPVPTCRALPVCPLGSKHDKTCTRDDFADRICFKVAMCGLEIPCRESLE